MVGQNLVLWGVVCLGLVATQPRLVAADTTQPVLTEFDFTPKSIHTASGAALVTVTLSGTDEQSGVQVFYAWFKSPSGTERAAGVSCDPPVLNCAMRSVDIAFPQYGEGGTWTVSQVLVQDAVGNYKLYSTAELSGLGFPTTLAVTSNWDTAAPALTQLSYTPAIDTRTAPGTVKVTFSSTDDVSGTQVFHVWFRSPSGTERSAGSGCNPPATSCGGQVDVAFPQYGEGGTWALSQVLVQDVVGNYKLYSTPELSGLGFPTTLEVTSNWDNVPPALTQFDFSPKWMDTTTGQGTVRVTFAGTDNLSGLQVVHAWFRSPAGTERSAGSGCNPPATSCGGQLDVVFPQYGDEGIWTASQVLVQDPVGNYVLYYDRDLEARGMPTSLLAAHATTPELLVRNASATPGELKAKKRAMTLQALVENIGSVAAGKVAVEFAYSADGGATFERIARLKAGDLAVGGVSAVKTVWSIAPGTYQLRVTVDPEDRIAEYSEVNNDKVYAVTVL